MSEEKKEKKVRKRALETYGKAQLREENYFKIKLETSRETLASAERKVEHLDIQIQKLKERFDHDKKVYDDQVVHMQKIISNMKERIPKLERKIKLGYTTVDLKTGKSYKSLTQRHIGHLEEKLEWTKANQKHLEQLHKQKQELRKKRRERLKPEEVQIVQAEEIRESLQGKDEIREVYEKQMEVLQKKKDAYQQQLEQLKQPKESKIVKKKPISLDDLEAELRKDRVIPSIPDESLSNGERNEVEILTSRHPGWIEKYNLEEGGNAIWQGRITNGFRAWLKLKGYKIGE